MLQVHLHQLLHQPATLQETQLFLAQNLSVPFRELLSHFQKLSFPLLTQSPKKYFYELQENSQVLLTHNFLIENNTQRLQEHSTSLLTPHHCLEDLLLSLPEEVTEDAYTETRDVGLLILEDSLDGEAVHSVVEENTLYAWIVRVVTDSHHPVLFCGLVISIQLVQEFVVEGEELLLERRRDFQFEAIEVLEKLRKEEDESVVGVRDWGNLGENGLKVGEDGLIVEALVDSLRVELDQ